MFHVLFFAKLIDCDKFFNMIKTLFSLFCGVAVAMAAKETVTSKVM